MIKLTRILIILSILIFVNIRGHYLHEAALNGDLEEVKFILNNNNLDIDLKDSYGATALYYAAMSGHIDIVQYLVKKGANVNLKNNIGQTSLHLAYFMEFHKVAKYLVDNGADINLKDNSGRTPLYFAAGSSLEAVKYLVKNGAKVNTKNEDGDTPLHHASEHSKLGIVKFLIIKKKIFVDIRGSNGNTPLLSLLSWRSSSSEIFKVVKFLVTTGANINAKDNEGYGVFYFSAILDNEEIDNYLRMLIKK